MRATLRRPRTLVAGGVCVGALVLGGCSGDLSPDEQAACDALLVDLPSSLADLDEAGSDESSAAYGDPAIEVTCGVEPPGDYDDISDCTQSAGVGWYIPPEQIGDAGADVTVYAMSHTPVVEVEIPADYRPEGPATVMADLGPAVVASLEEVNPCR